MVPILIPKPHGDLASLVRAAEAATAAKIPFIVDPILDPIHFGFAASLSRYIETRRRLPEAEIMMGTGNLTELTEADSSGVTALLLGLCSELFIRNVLVVQVRTRIQAARSPNMMPHEGSCSLRAKMRRCPRAMAPVFCSFMI